MKIARLLVPIVLLALLVIPLSAGSGGPAPESVLAAASPAELIGTEDISKRTACAKHYWNADGTMQAKVWTRPIHYQDRTGRWHDITPKAQCVVEGTTNELPVVIASGVRPSPFLPSPTSTQVADLVPSVDTLVSENYPTRNYSNEAVLEVHDEWPGSGGVYTYVKWASITDALYGPISNVVLHFKVAARSPQVPATTVAVANPIRDWDASITWDTQPLIGSFVTTSFDVSVEPGDVQTWFGALMDPEVEGWRTDPEDRDRGLCIKFSPGSIPGDYIVYHSSEAADPADWPYLSFDFVDLRDRSAGGCSSGAGSRLPAVPLLILILLLAVFRRR